MGTSYDTTRDPLSHFEPHDYIRTVTYKFYTCRNHYHTGTLRFRNIRHRQTRDFAKLRTHVNFGPLSGHTTQFGQYQERNISDQCDGNRTRLRSSQPADEIIHVTIADRPPSNIAEDRQGRPPNQRLEERFLADQRLLNQGPESKIHRWSQSTEYKAKRSPLPLSLSNDTAPTGVGPGIRPVIALLQERELPISPGVQAHGANLGSAGTFLTSLPVLPAGQRADIRCSSPAEAMNASSPRRGLYHCPRESNSNGRQRRVSPPWAYHADPLGTSAWVILVIRVVIPGAEPICFPLKYLHTSTWVSNTRLAQAASGCAPSVDVLPIFDVKQQSVRNPARMGANQPSRFSYNNKRLGRNDSELEAEGKPKRLLGSPSFGFGKSRVQGRARRARYSLPSWVISLARVPHVFGKVGAMHQSTVDCLVFSEYVSHVAKVSGDAGLLRVVKMMIVVVVIFAVCWLPFHVYFIITPYFPEITNEPYIQEVFLGIYWLAMSNSMYNPIIYCWMNSRFRRGFAHFFSWCPMVHVPVESTLSRSEALTSRYSCTGSPQTNIRISRNGTSRIPLYLQSSRGGKDRFSTQHRGRKWKTSNIMDHVS
ncbi:Tachykinin-like peptides receptor 99D [Melipona quadrifasciata]|uniref:Tachykinin-like peptides receptor 99D n=1 Tax=Melipona quadrifasciata TaxID=166423 RepID=A0A0M9A1K2_9HYME|nr:Tachykinin-like peptides receptor 99D [Melipona quadrifasciata]